MPQQKSLKTLFVETVMFISLFALMGHLSVNFWERYIIQSELSKMKISLHSLKDTINNIGIAYDHLHKELKGLAEIAEKPPSKEKRPDKFESKGQSTLTQQILHDIHVQAANPTSDIYVDATYTTVDKNTQKSLHDHKMGKNATLSTHSANKGDKKTGSEIRANSEKTTQHLVGNTQKIRKKVQQIKNATTITRNPLKSTAAGRGPSAYSFQENLKKNSKRNRCVQSNIHRCRNENFSTDSEYYHWKF